MRLGTLARYGFAVVAVAGGLLIVVGFLPAPRVAPGKAATDSASGEVATGGPSAGDTEHGGPDLSRFPEEIRTNLRRQLDAERDARKMVGFVPMPVGHEDWAASYAWRSESYLRQPWTMSDLDAVERMIDLWRTFPDPAKIPRMLQTEARTPAVLTAGAIEDAIDQLGNAIRYRPLEPAVRDRAESMYAALLECPAPMVARTALQNFPTLLLDDPLVRARVEELARDGPFKTEAKYPLFMHNGQQSLDRLKALYPEPPPKAGR